MLDDVLAGFYAFVITFIVRETHLVELFYDTTVGEFVLSVF